MKVLQCGECNHEFLPCQSKWWVPDPTKEKIAVGEGGQLFRVENTNLIRSGEQPDTCPECIATYFYEVSK